MSSEWAEQPAVPASHGVPGRALAAQREAVGWTVEQVADQLKLAVRQVVAIEAGDYASLPSPAVVRGFVRAYAKILKLDAAPLVAMIALDAPVGGESGASSARRDKPASFSEVRFPSNGKRKPLPLGLIAGVVVVIAAAAAAWQFGLVPGALVRGDSAGAAAHSTVLAPPLTGSAGAASGNAGAAADTRTLQSTSVPLISVPPPSAPALPGANSPAGVAPASPPAATAPAAASATANALVITVREDSWIELRPAKGAPLIARLVKGGSTETFDLTQPATLIVGKPEAVAATLRGAAVALPPVPGKTLSRVSLK